MMDLPTYKLTKRHKGDTSSKFLQNRWAHLFQCEGNSADVENSEGCFSTGNNPAFKDERLSFEFPTEPFQTGADDNGRQEEHVQTEDYHESPDFDDNCEMSEDSEDCDDIFEDDIFEDDNEEDADNSTDSEENILIDEQIDENNGGELAENDELHEDFVEDIDGYHDGSEENVNEQWDEEELRSGDFMDRSQNNWSDSFDRDNAVNYIAAIFLCNKISKNLAYDIFKVSKTLRQYEDINVGEIWKTMESWTNYDTRMYTFCATCSMMLSSSSQCLNSKCARFQVSQARASLSKKVMTFSVRLQLTEMLNNGSFDPMLLTPSTTLRSLTTRLSDTQKYIERRKEAVSTFPDHNTLFVTLNTDGFTKRGNARLLFKRNHFQCETFILRGEVWPIFVAATDLILNRQYCEEFRPESVMLSAMMITSESISSTEISALFERLRKEIEETSTNPLLVTRNGIQFKIRIEIFQCVFDLAACKKLHGIPIWQLSGCCARCDTKGTRIKTKRFYKMAWFSSVPPRMYDNSYTASQLIKTWLPPPWNDGYDLLHLIHEGTSKVMVNASVTSGGSLKLKLSTEERKCCSDALENSTIPKGRTTMSLLDPIKLKSRTGREIQEIYNQLIPTLILSMKRKRLWMVFMYFHWIVTRMIINPLLKDEDCGDLQTIANVLRVLTQKHFPSFYSMKFHLVVDHLVKDIQMDGSPMLSSAGPFERLNQVLGRKINAFTTNSFVDMSKRFLGLQRAVHHVEVALSKIGAPARPLSLVSLLKSSEREVISLKGIDKTKLDFNERNALGPRLHENNVFRLSVRVQNKEYWTSRHEKTKLTKSCYVYYADEDSGKLSYGSIERLFETKEGTIHALIKKFSTDDPFHFLFDSLQNQQDLRNASELCHKHNSFFLRIVESKFSVIRAKFLLGFISLSEFNEESFLSRF